MTLLTPLAVQNAPVLRAIAASPVPLKVADLAAMFGRDVENQRKTLKALAAAGLLQAPAFTLTQAGEATLAAIARAEQDPPPPAGEVARPAEGGTEGALAAAGVVHLRHAQIAPDPLNPRKHFDQDAIAELAESIAQDGLLENLVVRPAEPDGSHRLVAGERRWRAIARLVADGRWPAEAPILCKVVDIDDAAHRRIALVENLQRKDLRPIDEAEALKALMAVTGAGTADVAKEIGFTQRFVQQRLQLLELPDYMRTNLNGGQTTIEEARRFLARQAIEREAAAKKVLPLDELLAMAEIMDVAARYPERPTGWHYGEPPVPIGYRALEEGDPVAKLVARGFLKVTRRWRSDPRTFVQIAWPWSDKDLDKQLPGWRGKDRLRVYLGLRCRVIGSDEAHRIQDSWLTIAAKTAGARGEYATWALNAPFPDQPDPSLVEAAELADQAETEDNAAAFERKLQQGLEAEAFKTEQREALDRARHLEVWARAEDDDGFAAGLRENVEALGFRPPFTAAWDGNQVAMVDADGKLWGGRGGVFEAMRRLTTMTLNRALGFPTSSGPDFADTPWAKELAGAGADAGDPDAGIKTTNDIAFLDDEDDGEPLGTASTDEDDEDIPEFLTRLAGGAEADARP